MPTTVKELLEDALALPATERATLADELLASLDRPDPRIDALWAREAEHRLAEFEAGRMRAIPADEVFARFAKP
jgi:putative addiction module component (TIGR02574 family)